ncbi:MAG TPA: ABC transporter permease [Mycobacterium sp.]
MYRFALSRLGSLTVVLFSLSVLIFVLGRLGGGDPVRSYLGANASPEAVATARERLGLDRALVVQYWDYLSRILQGDFGLSISTRRTVGSELSSRLPATLELAFWTVLFTIVLAVALARICSLRGRFAGVIRFVLFSAASAPSFLVATAGLLIFFGSLHLLPVSGRTSYGPSEGLSGFYVLDGVLSGNLAYSLDALAHLVLPVVAAGLAPGVALARVLADGLDASAASGYARTARALGETDSQILRRHALRNAASPALSMLGVLFGAMLTSLVVVEGIFSWNGLGQYLVRAIGVADINSVATISLILGAACVVLNAFVDIGLAVLDPRIRLT